MPEWMFLPMLIVPYLFYRGGYRSGYNDAKAEPPPLRAISAREAIERGWFPPPDDGDSE